MKKFIKKADILLLIALVVFGLVTSVVLVLTGSGDTGESEVVIKSGGEIVGRYPLSKDARLEIPAASGVSYDSPAHYALTEDDECTQYTYYNVVNIEGGAVSITGSSCKNLVCVRHESISKSGQSIVCLPNRLIVTIENKSGGDYDSITS